MQRLSKEKYERGSGLRRESKMKANDYTSWKELFKIWPNLIILIGKNG